MPPSRSLRRTTTRVKEEIVAPPPTVASRPSLLAQRLASTARAPGEPLLRSTTPAASRFRIHEGEDQLVISLDVGATFSAASWQLLQKGSPVLEAKNVTTWQNGRSSFPKTPSQVLYKLEDGTFRPIAFGRKAEVDLCLDAETVLVKNFKLCMHPKHMQEDASASDAGGRYIYKMPELPGGLTALRIYMDFIEHLIERVKEGMCRVQGGREEQWTQLINSAHFILGAPNGWDLKEKGPILQAFRASSYYRETARVTFISEAEASLYFVERQVQDQDRLLPITKGSLYLICDGGGSTVDLTLYRCISESPRAFREERSSKCLQKGGYFVSAQLESYIDRQLKAVGTRMQEEGENDQKIAKILQMMKEAALESFRQDIESTWDEDLTDAIISVGSRIHDYPDLGIKCGFFTIPAYVVNEAFDYCVNALLRAIGDMCGTTSTDKPSILLVGGFGCIPYLHSRIKKAFPISQGFITYDPTYLAEGGSKAVSVGAAYSALYRDAITARGAYFDYGVETMEPCHVPHDPEGLEPQIWPDQNRYLSDVWTCLVKKDQPQAPGQWKSFEFSWVVEDDEVLGDLDVILYKCLSNDPIRRMRDRDGALLPAFEEMGRIVWSNAGLCGRQSKRTDGSRYTVYSYNIQIAFGGLDISVRILSKDRVRSVQLLLRREKH